MRIIPNSGERVDSDQFVTGFYYKSSVEANSTFCHLKNSCSLHNNRTLGTNKTFIFR